MQFNINFFLQLFPLLQSIISPIDPNDNSLNLSGSSCKSETKFNLFNSKTDYEIYANLNKESDDFTVPGSDPIGIWHLSRHGARYPDTDDINEIVDVLSKVRDDILNRDNHWLCPEDKELLKKWQSRLKPEYDTNLTPKGLNQQKALGKRIQQRLPYLMEKIEHNIQVSVAATSLNRTQQSANAYLSGFLDFLPNKPNLTVNYEQDFLLKFPDYCDKYIDKIKENKSACPEKAVFDENSIEFKNALEIFKQRVNTSLNYDNFNLFELALKSCQYEYLIDSTEDQWCKFFDQKLLSAYAYREDISYNCKYGYRYEITSRMTCDLVSNLLESLDKIKFGGLRKAYLLFSHTSTVLPFLSAMEISKDSSNFNYKNITDENKDRLFKLSELDPMNANIAFVLYRTSFKKPISSRFPKYYLKAFRNEEVLKLKACDYEKNCDLKKFVRYYKDFIKDCGSTEKVCQV